jgi:predicted transcriptional regulator of viral defense system
MYSLPNQSHTLTIQHSLAQATAYSKKIVICLLSALRFHNIGTQLPHVLWIAIPTPNRTPKIPDIELQVIRMNDKVFNAGIEEHLIEGQNVRIFSAAKTIADCFRYRSSVGIEASLEALKDGLIKGKFSINELYEFAIIDRVWNIMEPYIEALT